MRISDCSADVCSSDLFCAGLVPTPATCSVSSPWSQMTFKGFWSVAISLGVSTMRKQPSPLPNEDYGPKPDHSASRAGVAVLFACVHELQILRAKIGSASCRERVGQYG